MKKCYLKGINSSIAVVLCTVILVSSFSAYADEATMPQWQSNLIESSDDGASVLLHDDYISYSNVDVYVENTGAVPIYVRIYVKEYLDVNGTTLVGTVADDESGYVRRDFTGNLQSDGTYTDPSAKANDYYTWQLKGSQKLFRQGKANDDKIYSATEYSSYINDYTVNTDIPANSFSDGSYLQYTLPQSSVITMSDYSANKDVYDTDSTAHWIIDTDGYAYWSKPLQSGNATNLFFDGLSCLNSNATLNYMVKFYMEAASVETSEGANDGLEIFQENATDSAKDLIDYYYECRKPGISSISVTQRPDKSTYYTDTPADFDDPFQEEFDPSGIQVIATYSDGTTEDVTDKVTYDKSGTFAENGTQTVTVSYKDAGVTATDSFLLTAIDKVGYFGKQLTGFEKSMYMDMVASLDPYAAVAYQDGNAVFESIAYSEESNASQLSTFYENNQQKATDTFYRALSAFEYDHPELFYVSQTSVSAGIGYYNDNGVSYIVIQIRPVYLDISLLGDGYTDYAVAQDDYNAQINKYTFYAKENNFNDLQKVNLYKVILTADNLYNESAALSGSTDGDTGNDWAWSAASALMSHHGDSSQNYTASYCAGLNYDTPIDSPVCQAYSNAFQSLCDASAVYCVEEWGNVSETPDTEASMHQWNIVAVDGVWYYIDVTYSDPLYSTTISSNGNSYAAFLDSYGRDDKYVLVSYDDMIANRPQLAYHYAYFLSSDKLSDCRGEEFLYPAVSATSYTPRTVLTDYRTSYLATFTEKWNVS